MGADRARQTPFPTPSGLVSVQSNHDRGAGRIAILRLNYRIVRFPGPGFWPAEFLNANRRAHLFLGSYPSTDWVSSWAYPVYRAWSVSLLAAEQDGGQSRRSMTRRASACSSASPLFLSLSLSPPTGRSSPKSPPRSDNLPYPPVFWASHHGALPTQQGPRLGRPTQRPTQRPGRRGRRAAPPRPPAPPQVVVVAKEVDGQRPSRLGRRGPAPLLCHHRLAGQCRHHYVGVFRLDADRYAPPPPLRARQREASPTRS